jgi:hypothetical protein
LQRAIHMFKQILFGMYCTQILAVAEFLDAIGTKDFRIFLLAIKSHLYSFEISISSNSRNLFTVFIYIYLFTVQLLYTVKEKGGKRDRKPYPLPNTLRNPYRNLNSENSQDYAQKPQQNCMFMNSASGQDTALGK